MNQIGRHLPHLFCCCAEREEGAPQTSFASRLALRIHEFCRATSCFPCECLGDCCYEFCDSRTCCFYECLTCCAPPPPRANPAGARLQAIAQAYVDLVYPREEGAPRNQVLD